MNPYKAYNLVAVGFCMVVLYLCYLTWYFGSFPFQISLTNIFSRVIANGGKCH